MNTISVRCANQDDAPVIYKFINELEDTQLDVTIFNQIFTRNLNTENIHYLVAVENEWVVGFLSCHGQVLLHHMGLVFEIQELFVHKDYRNRGIGAVLLNALREQIQELDYKLLEVCCNIKRLNTHQFYVSNGLQQTHYKFTQEHSR